VSLVMGDDLPRREEFRDRIRNRWLRRAFPFKGNWAWESQIGPLVFQWFHDAEASKSQRSKFYRNRILKSWLWHFRVGRFHVWNDSLWR
jgi:hypothetical protein